MIDWEVNDIVQRSNKFYFTMRRSEAAICFGNRETNEDVREGHELE